MKHYPASLRFVVKITNGQNAQMVKIISTDDLGKLNVDEQNLSKLWQGRNWKVNMQNIENVCEVSETRVRSEPQHHV